MNYELFNLERSVDTLLLNTNDPEENLEREGERISGAIKLALVNCSAELGKSYLRQHQYGLLALFDKLDQQGTANVTKKALQKSLEIYRILAALLEEMESRFHTYFNDQTSIPIQVAKGRIIEIRTIWARASAALTDNNYPLNFISYLENLVLVEQESGRTLSFGKVAYLKDFISNFADHITSRPNEELFDLLVYLVSENFNHPGFYGYCNSFIRQQKQSVQTPDGQVELLNYFKKCFQQVIPIRTGAYEPSLPAIKASILELINAEIAYLSIQTEASKNMAIDTKHFKVDFTVKQLAIFVNLQAASGIIISDKPKIIHEYITSHYSTQETAAISEKSFKNAFYGNNSSDLDKVLEKIAQMLIIGQRKY